MAIIIDPAKSPLNWWTPLGPAQRFEPKPLDATPEAPPPAAAQPTESAPAQAASPEPQRATPVDANAGKPQQPDQLQQEQPPQQKPQAAPSFSDSLVDTLIAEAGGEGPEGMAAVAHVIRNRALASGRTPEEIIATPKQFEGYYAPGSGSRKAQQDPALRQAATEILNGVFTGQIPDPTGGADHFHAASVRPSWAGKMPRTAQIGDHAFYKGGNFPGMRGGGKPAEPAMPEGEDRRGRGGDPTGRGLARLATPGSERDEEQTRQIAGLANTPIPRLDPQAIGDLTSEGSAWNFGNLQANSLVIHHTGGRGTVNGVVQTFKDRGFPAHFIIDRKGQVHQVLGLDQRGRHTRRSNINDISNINSWGVEIIARDDSDVTPKQVEAALSLTRYLNEERGMPLDRVYGHGEINSHKQATEGSTVVSALRAFTGEASGGQHPAFAAFDRGAGAQPAAAGERRNGNVITVNAEHTWADPMGLYRGQPTPTAAPRGGGSGDVRLPATAPLPTAAQPARVNEQVRQLNEKEPGRYQAIPAASYDEWRKRWEEGQMPDPLTATGWVQAGAQAVASGAIGSAGASIQGIGVLLKRAGAESVGSLFERAGASVNETAGKVGPDKEYQGVVTDILSGLGSMGIYLAGGWASSAGLAARGVGATGQMLGGMGTAVALAGPAGSAEAYNRAIQHGETEERALETALPGFGAGAVQVAPVGLILRAIPAPMRGNAIAQARHIMEAAGGEFIAEGFGAVLQNLIESSYNPERGVWDNTFYQAAIGGAAGGLTQAAVSLATRGRGGPVGQPGTPTEEEAASTAPAGSAAPATAATAAPPAAGGAAPGPQTVQRPATPPSDAGGDVYVINDGPFGNEPAGPMHGQRVRLAPDQSRVPSTMRMVVDEQGREFPVGERLLQRTGPAPQDRAGTPSTPFDNAQAWDGQGSRPPAGTMVRVQSEAGEEFAAFVESYDGDDAMVLVQATGEELQVPASSLRPGGGAPSRAAQPATPAPAPAKPAASAPSSDTTGLAAMGSNMASGIGDSLRDQLWKQVEAGETTEAGAPSNILRAAKFARDAGGLQTREDFVRFADEWAAADEATKGKPDRNAILRQVIEKHAAPAASSGTPTPAQTAKPADRPLATEWTRGMLGQLRDLGWTADQIRKMTPQEADGILREGRNPDVAPVDPADPALAPAAPKAADRRIETPPAGEMIPVTKDPRGRPAPGSRVIVEAGGQRFGARVESYDGDEAVVVTDDNTPLQVPLATLQTNKLTPKEVERQDAQRDPPIERPRAQGPLIRPIVTGARESRPIEFPDDRHFRLYELSAARRQAQQLGGASSLERDQVMPVEQRRLAQEFGVDPQQIGAIADDYHHRVQRAARRSRTDLPTKVNPVHPKMLQRFRGERPAAETVEAETAAQATPAAEAIDAVQSSMMDPDAAGGVGAAGGGVESTAPVVDRSAELAARANEAATSPTNAIPEPTAAQKEAGNYRKGHVTYGGLDISIENPAGSVRSGTGRSGRTWSNEMKSHYGYIKGTVGKDKDHLDVFVNPKMTAEPTDASPVFVVDQTVPARKAFDEHKIMLGFDGADAARQGYMENYSPNWKGLGDMTETTMGEFRRWLAEGDTSKPFAQWKGARAGSQAEMPAQAPSTAPAASSASPAALERIAAGRAWFGDDAKAQAFIDKNGLGGTHTVERTGPKRFEVVAKPEGAAAAPETDRSAPPAAAVRPSELVDGQTVVAVSRTSGAEVDRGVFRGYDRRTGSAKIEERPGFISMRHPEDYDIRPAETARATPAPAAGPSSKPLPRRDWASFIRTATEANNPAMAGKIELAKRLQALTDREWTHVERYFTRDMEPGVTLEPEKGMQAIEDGLRAAREAEKSAPATSTAPEHAAVGVDDRELGQIVDEFNDAQATMQSGEEQIHHLFDAPAKGDIVRLQDKAKVYHRDHGWMTPAEARKLIEQWKDHAEAQGKTRQNADKVVLSLFDYTGAWSKPWEDAGYQVFRFDIQNDPQAGDVHNFSTEFFGDWFGDFDGQDIYAILAACPCTDFASSGARHFAAKDKDGRTVASVKLVHQTLATIEHFRPAVWAIENPVGRIEKLGGLPPWRLSFDPNHLGDPYTKKTLLWGRFNADLPVAPVEPTEGSKMHSQYGGNSIATKNARSVTPEGFAYGFFMANNAIDHPAMAVANKYDRLDPKLIERAIDAGMTPQEIGNLVDDPYYIELDDAAAEKALRDAIATSGPATTPDSSPAAQPRATKAVTPEPAAPEIRPANTPAAVEQRLEEMFAKNKLFTADKVEAARKRLKSKLRQINSGIDPEVLIDGMTIAGAYIEAGIRNFSDYATRMTGDFGDGIRPYLLSFWEGARNYPGIDTEGMTTPEESARLHASLNEKLPASEALALGTEMKKPAKRTPKRGRPQDRTLTDDWGVDHIDGYGTDPSREVGNDVKDAFLKEATQYLQGVAGVLSDEGFSPPSDAKGRPGKVVRANEAGAGVSGDVSLSMEDPQSGKTIEAVIADSSLRGTVPTTKSGISVVFRANSPRNGGGTAYGINRWAPTTLTAGELAAMMLAEARGRTTPAQIARPEVETPDGIPSVDTAGQGALEAVPAEPVRGAGEGGQAAGSAGTGGRDDVSGGGRAGERGDTAGRGLSDGEGTVPVPAAGRSERRGRADAAEPDARDEQGSGPGEPGVRGRAAGKREPELDLFSAATPAQERPTGYAITDADQIGEGGAKTKFRNNVDAIKLVKQLAAEARPATRSEQAALAKWVGWGGLSQAFFRPDGSVAKGWAKEAAELQEILTEDEYAAARRSTQDAHYTSPEVVRALWSIADRLGFRGGQVLEPSVGAGNFLGLMPADRRAGSQITAVELDPVTGGIAKNLYPGANVIAPMGFQHVSMPDGYFDLAIGNPPFGRTAIYDGERRHLNRMSIHNYFFGKSLDALRPGGVLTMVVSNFLMDSTNARSRQYLASQADLVAAIRLPNTAFLQNAGTEVTTDIVVLRKRTATETPGDSSWTEVGTYTDPEGREVNLNRYFIDNPDMMLGQFGAYGTMYAGESAALIEKDGQDTPALLEAAIERLPRNVMPLPGEIRTETIEVPREASEALVGSMFTDGKGNLFRREPDRLGKPQAEAITPESARAGERLAGMVRIRDSFARLRRAQIDEKASDQQIAKLREDLNRYYDAFVAKHGPINLPANKRLFREDPTWPQISALENNFDKGLSPAVAQKTGEKARKPSADKAAIFKRRTQQPYVRPTKAGSAKDALAQVLADYGRVDMAAMARLYGRDEAAIIDELGPLLYRAPDGHWETADAYLSGNVRQKLAEARRAAESDPAFRRNVVALEDVQPADIEPVDIDAKAGSPWIPARHISDFLDYITNGHASQATYIREIGRWELKTARADDAAQTQWGTDRVTVGQVVEAAINDRTITVTDPGPQNTRVVNQSATEAANEKVERVKDEWRRWLWEEEGRRVELARLYNDTFNTDVLRVFDGSHLSLPGKVADDVISLRPHQKSFIWRAMQTPTALADHTVGAGKTFAAIAAVMEKRRIGQWRKPAVVVPNHLVGQWAADFVKLYPGAQVLAATKNDFTAANRKRFFARMATGDWDAIIIPHSSFGRIGVAPETQAAFIQEQVTQLEQSIRTLKEQDGGGTRTIKQVEAQRDRQKEKLQALYDQKGKDEGLVFDELGIDGLVVDEAHEFKNLEFSTSMNRVAGLGNPIGSQKAADLHMKARLIRDRTGGNVIFLSGTPISNTMAEMYTVQRYLDDGGLRALGAEHFDAWARIFGEVVTDWELSPAGKYKLTKRFARFVNIPELMQRYLSFADVITNDDIRRQLAERGEVLPIPRMKGGRPANIVVQRSDDQAVFSELLIQRAENLPKKITKGADNMLKVMSDARKAALDMRLIDPGYSDYAGSKIHVAADRMVDLWRRWRADSGTQLVFIDLSTPKNAKSKEAERIRDLARRAEQGDEAAQEQIDRMSPDEFSALESEFSVYDDLKQKLIDRGIPAHEIAFIHDANTDLQKEELFGKVRSGQVRFLFGSTAKMGAGTNVQERLVGLHHLDAPWRPSDLEQREGRIIRQGNVLYARDPDGFEVEVNRYATEKTLDSRMWQTIESKARFIGQVRAGTKGARVIEDIGGEVMNAAEMKAAASGNPLILEEMDLRQKVRKIENRAREHDREQHRIIERLRGLESEKRDIETRMAGWRADAETAAAALEAGVVTIDGKAYDKPGEYGNALLTAGVRMLQAEKDIEAVGSMGGFTIRLENTHDRAFLLHLDGAVPHSIRLADDLRNADNVGTALRLRNAVARMVTLPAERAERQRELGPLMQRLTDQRGAFDQADELVSLRARHNQIIEQLKPKQQQTAPGEAVQVEAGPDVQASLPPSRRRSLGFPAGRFPTIFAARDDSALKAHPDYRLAKAGDAEAAMRLVPALVDEAMVARVREAFGTDVIFVAPFAEEASGPNAIPGTLAQVLANRVDAIAEHDIVQTSRAFHTGARPLDRLLGRAVFAGPVQAGRRYVLVDDVTVMGGTLAELSDFIRASGGEVAGVVTLANASRSGIKPAPKQYVRKIEERYGEIVREEFGVEPGALTSDEALVILNARDADALRDRISQAKVERERRLVRKGVPDKEGGSEGRLAGAGAPDTLGLSDADRAAIADIIRDVAGLDRVGFAKRITLESAEGWGVEAPVTAEGFYDPGADIIMISMQDGGTRTAWHEAFHRLQRFFLDDAERAVLKAERGRLRRMVASDPGRRGQLASMSANEIEAEAFAIFADGGAIKPHKTLQAAWKRVLDAIRRVSNYLAGRGFQTVDDVFNRAAAGETARRAPRDRAPAQSELQAALPRATDIVAKMKGKATDWTPAMLGAVPLNYFTELKRPTMTAVDEYLKVKRAMDAYRGKKHAEMNDVSQDWRKFARLGWGPAGRKGKARAAALADLMHESTLAGVDPSKTDAETQAHPDYARMRQAYMALPPSGRELYRKVRDAYHAQAEETDRIILDNIRKAQEIAERKAEEQFRADLAKIHRTQMSKRARDMAIEDAERAHVAARWRAKASMKARLTRLRQQFEASRVPPPYFPLARFGDYFVLVKDVQGDVISFSKRETVADRDRLAEEMRKAYPHADVTTGVMDAGASAREAMDPRMVAEIENILGGAGLDPTLTATMLDQVWQRYLQTMPDLSVRKRFIHRKGLPGFEGDALRAFAHHMFHASHQMARLKYGLDLQESVNQTADQARKSDDPTRGTQLSNELRKRHDWVMNPTSAKWSTAINAISFAWMLGATPAAALVNMTQTPMLGIPILGARLGGATKAAAAIARASKDMVAGRGSVARGNLTADEVRAVEAFYESGMIERSQAHDLAGVGETGVEYSPVRERVMSVITWLYHNAELWNREVTSLAAYRMARAQGQSEAEAIDTAHDLTWKTHFDYSNASRARYLQKDWAKAVFVFQSHVLNMTYRMLRDAHQAFKGETKQARREARYQLAGIMGMMSLMAGGTGVFGYSSAMALLQMIFGDDDDPMDVEQQIKRAVLETLGPDAGGMVLKGVPGHLLGIELTSRIGMPYLWLRPETRELEGRAEFENFVLRAAGANIGMMANWWHGASVALGGDPRRGIEIMAPKFVKDAMKSVRYLEEGLTSTTGNELMPPGSLNGWDAIAQAMGFTPARVSETYERNSALYAAEDKVMKRRQQLLNEFALAHTLRDREARAEVIERIQKFNAVPVNRPVRITSDTLKRSMATRERNRAKREDGVLIQNERLGRDLREMLPPAVYR